MVTGTVATVALWHLRASTLPEPGRHRRCCTPKVASSSAFPFVTQELEWRILLFIVKVKQVMHEAALKTKNIYIYSIWDGRSLLTSENQK